MCRRWLWLPALLILCALSQKSQAQNSGSIRGTVRDADFEFPLEDVQIRVLEEDLQGSTGGDGNYLIQNVPSGRYTLIFSKGGFSRETKLDVVVTGGGVTEVNVELTGQAQQLDELVAQDVAPPGSAAELDRARQTDPAMVTGISEEMIGKWAVSDAGEAVSRVAGASLQDGKYAVIRGLPDRYVNSQMNGVRLPTADADKRAVQLDQFPSDVIQSVLVSKTFMPDQQGDASGGAVNVILKGIPNESLLKFGFGYKWNSQVMDNRTAFMTDQGGGVNCMGRNKGREIQYNRLGDTWRGAIGGQESEAPYEYSWSLALGGKYRFKSGLAIGGFGNFFYDRGASFYKDGRDDSWWVRTAGGGEMEPRTSGDNPDTGTDYTTSLYDVQRSSESVQWGALGAVGLEYQDQAITAMYMYTHDAQNKLTLAEDTRGKEYFVPGYEVENPTGADGQAPWLRNETIEYTERVTKTFQLRGEHTLIGPEIGFHVGSEQPREIFVLLAPRFDWTISKNVASMDQPDKRLFATAWVPPIVLDFLEPPLVIRGPTHTQRKAAANFRVGNLQRTWKDITEESEQYSLNLTFPFRQWTGHEGYLKLGLFKDSVDRDYNQQSYSNLDENAKTYTGEWEDRWSLHWPEEDHAIKAADVDVDYVGEQEISAWYYMVEFPFHRAFRVMGGARYETTELSIINDRIEDSVFWFPLNAPGETQLNPGDADVSFKQDDILPAIGFSFDPFDQITFRGSWSKTVARQTFKELSPIQQQEYLGGDVFIGNPELEMSALRNYDLRLDYKPSKGSLISASWFKKIVKNPIEYVQRVKGFPYKTPINYPEGRILGWEFEVRQDLGDWWETLDGITIGGNATFIDSEVKLPESEVSRFQEPNIDIPITRRDMMNAPEHLYNLYLNIDVEETGTSFGLIYSVRGDTLVAGAGQSSGNFIPDVYETEYGTLNLTISQKIGDHLKVKFAAKNLLNPKIESVYRSDFIPEDVVKTSYRKGIDFSVSIGAQW